MSVFYAQIKLDLFLNNSNEIFFFLLIALLSLIQSRNRLEWPHNNEHNPSVSPHINLDRNGRPTGAGVEVRWKF